MAFKTNVGHILYRTLAMGIQVKFSLVKFSLSLSLCVLLTYMKTTCRPSCWRTWPEDRTSAEDPTSEASPLSSATAPTSAEGPSSGSTMEEGGKIGLKA